MHLVELAFTAGQAINLSFFKKIKGFKFSSQTIASRLRSKSDILKRRDLLSKCLRLRENMEKIQLWRKFEKVLALPIFTSLSLG